MYFDLKDTKTYQEDVQRLEDTHWWFLSRRDCIIRLIRKLNTEKDSEILEVGCSGGPLQRLLDELGYKNVLGIDNDEQSIEVGRRRGITNIRVMDGTSMEYEDNSFDLLIASDVLEHIEDDGAALKEWNRILKPGGKAIIFVPAFRFLWSEHDEVIGHYRRYTRKELNEKLKANGFKILNSSYWIFLLFFPVALIRGIKNLLIKKQNARKNDLETPVNPVLNSFLTSLLYFENWFIEKGIRYPAGVSVFSVSENISETRT